MMSLSSGIAQQRNIFPEIIKMSKVNLILDVFKKGNYFGVDAIVSDGKSKFTFEAKSKKV